MMILTCSKVIYPVSHWVGLPTSPCYKQEKLRPFICCSCFVAFPHTHARLVVMLRRVLVVAGLAQLSRASTSLARTQCRRLLLLASRSHPSASPLGKLWLHHATKPLRCLSAAHCFSSNTTTTTTTTVRVTLSPSIILERVSMQVSH